MFIWGSDTVYAPNAGVPSNAFGHQPAHSGEAYVGIYCYSSIQLNMGEHIQVQLTDSIIPSIRYVVSFYASVADNGKYSVNTLGAFLSKDPIYQDNLYRFDVDPQVLNSPDNHLSDPDAWVLITDTFSSRYGGERYLTIGNFNPDSTSGVLFSNPQGDISATYAYYYIDDVSVVAIDSIPSSIGEAETLDFSVYPNPATAMVQLQGQGLVGVRLLEMSGRCLVAERITATMHTMHLNGIPQGLYLLEVTDHSGRVAVKKVVVH